MWGESSWSGGGPGGSCEVSRFGLSATTRPYLFKVLKVLMLIGGSESSGLMLIKLIE
jgi:hypothetical protein